MNPTAHLDMDFKAIRYLKNCKTQSNKRLLGLVVIIVFVNILIHFALWHNHIWSPLALLSLLLFYFVWFKYNTEHRIILSEKTKQIRQLLWLKFPLSGYYENIYIEQIDFTNSLLYDNLPFNYEGSNLMVGKNWAASNISVSQYLSKSNETISVFNGLFAKIKLQSYVKGYLIIKPLIIPDKKDIPKVLQQLIHRYFTPHVSSIATGNSIFDKNFEVFCKPSKLKSQILDSKMINRILEIEEKLHHCINTDNSIIAYDKNIKPALEISFTRNHMYVGVRGVKLFSIHENENSNYENDGIIECIEIIELISQLNNMHTKLFNPKKS